MLCCDDRRLVGGDLTPNSELFRELDDNLGIGWNDHGAGKVGADLIVGFGRQRVTRGGEFCQSDVGWASDGVEGSGI